MSDDPRMRFVEELYITYYDDIRKYAFRFTNYASSKAGMVEECVQDTFVKAFLNYDVVLKHANTIAWLKRACQNSLLDAIKKENRHTSHFINTENMEVIPNDDLDSFHRWLACQDAIDDLSTLLSALTPQETQICQDRFIDGLSIGDTADKNGMSYDATHATIKRIRRKAKATQNNFIFIFVTVGQIYLFKHYLG